MTKFNKDSFYGSEYVNYTMPDGTNKFVARFKYNKSNKASFISFLVKNFSVEEYFDLLQSGTAPLPILQAKGYVSPTVKKLLAKKGYPATAAGYKMMLLDMVPR